MKSFQPFLRYDSGQTKNTIHSILYTITKGHNSLNPTAIYSKLAEPHSIIVLNNNTKVNEILPTVPKIWLRTYGRTDGKKDGQIMLKQYPTIFFEKKKGERKHIFFEKWGISIYAIVQQYCPERPGLLLWRKWMPLIWTIANIIC